MGRSEEGRTGGHRGKGPKGYRRSDERITEEINERLTDHDELDAGEIQVSVQNGEVTLSGTVDHRFAKRLAEDVAEQISGVTEVHNRIRVKKQSESGSSTASGRSESTRGDGGRSETGKESEAGKTDAGRRSPLSETAGGSTEAGREHGRNK